MQGSPLYNFYECAVLPQFGIIGGQITWDGSQDIGSDETAHYFNIGREAFALIFEDHDGLGRSDDFIREHVLEHHSRYEFIEPVSGQKDTQSYMGFHLPAPYKYCRNVTGSFTLIRLI